MQQTLSISELLKSYKVILYLGLIVIFLMKVMSKHFFYIYTVHTNFHRHHIYTNNIITKSNGHNQYSTHSYTYNIYNKNDTYNYKHLLLLLELEILVIRVYKI